MTEQWTIEKIRSFEPCYSDQGLTDLRDRVFPDRDFVTPLEICDCEVIPVEDRIWLLCRSSAAPAAIERIATRAVKNHCLTCGVAEVEEWARKWLDGSDRSREATCAVRAYAADAAMAAAYAADAAMAAARAAAYAATYAAAWAAAYASYAARAAMAAERKLQLVDFREVLRAC